MRSEEEPLDLVIQPCFSGPFELPDDYELASPVFLIQPSRRVDFQKDVTIRICHHASLCNKEVCEDMVFLSASSTPNYKDSCPVYIFKEIRDAKTVFRPGDQVGEIALRHFCIPAIGKKKSMFIYNAYEGGRAMSMWAWMCARIIYMECRSYREAFLHYYNGGALPLNP